MKFHILKLDLEKAEEPEIKLPISIGSSKKQESSRKTSASDLFSSVAQPCPTLCDPMNCSTWFIGYAKPSDCVDHNNLWDILKEMEYQTT